MTAKRPWIEFIEAVGVTADGEVFVPRVTTVRDEETSPGDEVPEPVSTDDD